MSAFFKKYSAFMFWCSIVLLIFYAQFFTNAKCFDFSYAVYGDMWPQYVWHKLNDSTLFTNDALAQFFYKKDIFSFLNRDFFMAGILMMLTKIFSLTTALKVKSILICLISAGVLYHIVKHWYSRRAGYCCVYVFLGYTLSMDTFFGGEERAWGFLIILVSMLLISKKKYWFVPLVVLFTGITYISIIPLVITVCFSALVLFNRDKDNYPLKTRVLYLLFLTTVIFTVILYLFYNKSTFTTFFLQHPEKYFQYKYYFKIGDWHKDIIKNVITHFIFNIHEHSILYRFFTYFFIFSNICIFLWLKKESLILPQSLWIILISSFISFMLLFPFHPALASRQMIFSMPLFMVLFFVINITKLMKQKFIRELSAACFMGAFIFLHPFYNDIGSFKHYSGVFGYFEKLPQDIVVAAHPANDLVRFIPLFSKKKVFFLSDRFFGELTSGKDFMEMVPDDDVLGFINVIYSSSEKDIKKFFDIYPKTYWLVEERFFNEEYFCHCRESPFPFEQKIFDFIKRNNSEKKFSLLKMAKEGGFEISDNVFVLSRSNIEKLNKGKNF